MKLSPALAVAICLAAAPAVAQTPPASGVVAPATGGAGDRTGSVTSTGQTKPPGTAVDDSLGTRPDLEQKNREIDRQISKGICRGCD